MLTISNALKRIDEKIQKILPGTQVQHIKATTTQNIRKLIIKRNNTQIKIEPNEIIRGCVFPSQERELSKKVEELFGIAVSINTLSLADLYGGKICAALDRQHPRDLFDIKLLFDNEGLTEDIRKAFVIYLASHNRPIHELLNPNLLDIQLVFENEFAGMAITPIDHKTLLNTRTQLIQTLKLSLTEVEKKFLLSVKENNPDWKLLEISNLDNLPAIQWKLKNIQKMDKTKHQVALENLKRTLEF